MWTLEESHPMTYVPNYFQISLVAFYKNIILISAIYPEGKRDPSPWGGGHVFWLIKDLNNLGRELTKKHLYLIILKIWPLIFDKKISKVFPFGCNQNSV